MFDELNDVTREAIEERWERLASVVRKGEEFEAACKEAGADGFSTAMRCAMLALSSDMRNGYGPVVSSGTARAYYEENCGGGVDERLEFANDLAHGLLADDEQLTVALLSARDVLQSRAEELTRLAEMADAAID